MAVLLERIGDDRRRERDREASQQQAAVRGERDTEQRDRHEHDHDRDLELPAADLRRRQALTRSDTDDAFLASDLFLDRRDAGLHDGLTFPLVPVLRVPAEK